MTAVSPSQSSKRFFERRRRADVLTLPGRDFDLRHSASLAPRDVRDQATHQAPTRQGIGRDYAPAFANVLLERPTYSRVYP